MITPQLNPPIERCNAVTQNLYVVGAGLMGSGIAQVAAAAGWQVTMRDVDDAALGRGCGGHREVAEPGSLTRSRSAADESDAALGRISDDDGP